MEELITKAIVSGIEGQADKCCYWDFMWTWGYWISFIVGVAGSVYLLVKKEPDFM